MAVTPVNDSYTGASGSVISGGRFRLPSWRRAIAPGTWGPVGTHTMSEVDPANDPAYNPNYPGRAPWGLKVAANANFGTNNGVVMPWCGATITPDGVIDTGIGGGHGDYGGNENYRQNLMLDNPEWRMVRPPSGSVPLIAGGLPAGSTPQGNSFLLDDGLETTGVYADGRPRSFHSYRRNVYAPGVGPVIVRQGGCFTSTYAADYQTWLQNETTGEWERKDSAYTTLAGLSTGAACYDSTRGCIYWLGAGTARILRLDLDAWLFSVVGTGSVAASSGDVAITHIPEHDVIFEACSYFSNKFCIRDAVTSTPYYPDVVGVTPPSGLDGATGLDWVPSLGAMVFLTSTTGSLHTLSPTGNAKTDPWEWAVLSTSTTPPALTTVGVYSKFGYSARLKGLYRIGQNSIPTWFFATE